MVDEMYQVGYGGTEINVKVFALKGVETFFVCH
jgi:hypothetical protein